MDDDGKFRGYADFLIKVNTESDLGSWSYEVYDTKIARNPKPLYVLQITAYSEMLGKIKGSLPTALLVLTPYAKAHTLKVNEFIDYFIYFFIIRLSIYIFETILIAFTPSECSLAAHQNHNADTYEEWREAAEKLDQLQNRSPRFEEGYNWKFLVNTTEQLKQSVIDRDIKKLLSVLQVCTRNNVGGIMNEELFNKTHLGEPKIEVNEFIDAVVAAIESV
jgi:hypothetical protein